MKVVQKRSLEEDHAEEQRDSRRSCRFLVDLVSCDCRQDRGQDPTKMGFPHKIEAFWFYFRANSRTDRLDKLCAPQYSCVVTLCGIARTT